LAQLGVTFAFVSLLIEPKKNECAKAGPMLLPLLFGLGPFPFEQEKRVFTVAITQNSTLLQKYCWWPTAGPANW